MATMRTTHSTPHCCVSLSVFSALFLPPLWHSYLSTLVSSFSSFSAFSVSLRPSVALLFCLLSTFINMKPKKKNLLCLVFLFFVSTCDQSDTCWEELPVNSTFSSHHTLSSSPRWLHCVPVMWDGIPTGGLQESGVLHREHWNWCCHELDHGPYGWSRWAEWWRKKKGPRPSSLLCSCFMRSSLWSTADFSAPLVLPGCSSGPGTTPTESLSEEHLATIVSMGFSRDQATKALRATVRTELHPDRILLISHSTCLN